MTRILVVTNMYPPHHYGGYELSCRDVVERLRARGHEVTVLTSRLRLPGVTDDSADTDVRRALHIYYRSEDLYAPPLPVAVAWERGNQRALRQAVRETRPDVVSIWAMGAMSFALLTTLVKSGIPLVYSVCDDWLVYGRQADRWTRFGLEHRRTALAVGRAVRLPVELPDLGASGAFCFVSESTRRRAEEWSPWTFPGSTVVYSGIDTHDFPVAEPHADAQPWRWRLLYVGRLDERKGIATAVEALAKLPAGATLEVLGGGDDRVRRRLEQRAAGLGVAGRLKFDRVDRSELRNRYRDADVLLFPSEWDEPFGLTPVEAMACATPVVATGTGGSAEYLEDGVNCILFEPGNAAALAAAVSKLAGDSSLRTRLVANGIVTARELDVDHLADTMEAWHVGAAERFASGRPTDRVLPRSRAQSE